MICGNCHPTGGMYKSVQAALNVSRDLLMKGRMGGQKRVWAWKFALGAMSTASLARVAYVLWHFR